MNIKYQLKTLWLSVSGPIRKTYTANVCGHHTKKTGKITSLGETFVMSLPLQENGNPDYCLDCIAKMSIKCAWCGNPIHIGSPITLYSPSKSFNVPKYAVPYQKDPKRFVGCLGWNCADTGADRQGFWVPPGEVERVLSPFEMAASTGKMVIVSDLGDPKNLGQLIE